MLRCYEWMLCHLLVTTSQRISKDIDGGSHRFEARNNSQVYGAREMSTIYAEYYCLHRFIERFQRPDVSGEYSNVLRLVFDVYAMWCLDKHMTTFYVGGFANGSRFADLIRTRLLQRCGDLKDSAVSVADALAPPDFALNSVIAKSDGLLYENLQHEFMTNAGAFQRPPWWSDIIIPQVKSKL